MKIIDVVAASENNVIGIGNAMPWHLPDDFKFFKKITIGNPILMGKNTWRSIGSKPLPDRTHFIVSTTLEVDHDAVYVFHDLEEALAYLRYQKTERIYIIGGGSIYEQLLPITDEVYMTRIHTNIEHGEVFFPEIRNDEWIKISDTYHPKDEKHALDFTFEHWVRK